MSVLSESIHKKKRDGWELAIAIFKFFKAALFLALAIGLVSLLDKDAAEIVQYRIWQLGFDPQNAHLRKLIITIGLATDKDLALISIVSFLYSGLFLTEGIGLWLQKRWGELLTSIITGSFIPFEIFELTKHFTWFKIIVIAINVATVIYLVVRIKKR